MQRQQKQRLFASEVGWQYRQAVLGIYSLAKMSWNMDAKIPEWAPSHHISILLGCSGQLSVDVLLVLGAAGRKNQPLDTPQPDVFSIAETQGCGTKCLIAKLVQWEVSLPPAAWVPGKSWLAALMHLNHRPREYLLGHENTLCPEILAALKPQSSWFVCSATLSTGREAKGNRDMTAGARGLQWLLHRLRWDNPKRKE
ncbi:hypothetical protein BGX38DRAFT_692805 [Terfezia claveryi]|nr:hypothetical protein BGX38DRAFT_692805 [Terfezia claveryi]